MTASKPTGHARSSSSSAWPAARVMETISRFRPATQLAAGCKEIARVHEDSTSIHRSLYSKRGPLAGAPAPQRRSHQNLPEIRRYSSYWAGAPSSIAVCKDHLASRGTP